MYKRELPVMKGLIFQNTGNDFIMHQACSCHKEASIKEGPAAMLSAIFDAPEDLELDYPKEGRP